MDKENNQMDESQILAYLKGEELSSSQTDAVEKWLQDEDNKAEARALYQAWELSALVSAKNVDSAKAWKVITAKTEFKPDHKGFRVSWPAIGIAASFAVVALTGLFLFYRPDPQPLVFQARDTKLEVRTPDGSLLVLNRNTSATYTEEDGSRLVHLKGEAYFEVTKNDFPFVVQVFNLQVKVLGTKFRIKPLPDSSVQVLVTEGSVSVTNPRSGETFIVKPHEELLLSKKAQIRTSNANDLYWITETLKFENEPLSNVFETLSKEFNIAIELSNPKISNCSITATFKKQNLQTILTVLGKTHSLEFTRNGDAYIVAGEGCYE